MGEVGNPSPPFTEPTDCADDSEMCPKLAIPQVEQSSAMTGPPPTFVDHRTLPPERLSLVVVAVIAG